MPYLWDGTWHRYEPDFVARLFGDREDEDAVHLIVECKGVPDSQSERKKQSVVESWDTGGAGIRAATALAAPLVVRGTCIICEARG